MNIQIFMGSGQGEVIMLFFFFFSHVFIPVTFPSEEVFIRCACVQNVLWSTRVFASQMECSPSIRQQKHKMKETLFCSSIREKHLAESWWEGERHRGGRARKTKSA